MSAEAEVDSATSDDRRKTNPLWSGGAGQAAMYGVRILIYAAVLTLFVLALWELRVVVIPLIIAIMIAAAVWPLVGWLQAHRVPKSLAALLALLTGIGAVALVLWLVVSGVSREWPALSAGVVEGIDALRVFLANGPVPVTEEQLEQGRDALLGVLSGQAVGSAALKGAVVVGEVIAGIFLTVVILFFILKDGPNIWTFVQRAVPLAHRDRSQRIGERCVDVLGGYVRGTAIIALVDAVLIGATLAILQVPLALPLALLVFVGAFIPLAGATVSGLVAALVTLVANGPVAALIVLAVVIIVNQLEGDILAPLVLGRAVMLHPLAILLALAAGTIVAGIIGALLAVPLVAITWTIITSWNNADEVDRRARAARERARDYLARLRHPSRRSTADG